MSTGLFLIIKKKEEILEKKNAWCRSSDLGLNPALAIEDTSREGCVILVACS